MSAAVEIKGVRKDFGSQPVLNGIDLSIRAGEFLVLVGPSGCGKSTLLRLLAGLEDVSAGEISIGGKVVNELSPKGRGVAMVFQSYALYPHMSVWNNMAFALKMAKTEASEIKRRVHDAAKILGLEAHLEKKPQQLSGGQKQRVAMGRAMVRRPAVFLFDEPLSNLDAQLRVKMRAEIALLHRRLGATMIYVTHDQVEAMTLADRIAILNAGQLEQVGPPLAVYRSPETRFVAGFIGTPAMNFLPAGVVPGAPALAQTVGFRPEATLLGQNAGDSTPLGNGRVKLVELLGNTAHVHLEVGDNVVIAEVKTASLPERGTEMPIGVKSPGFFFFDDAGKRLGALPT